MIYNPIDQFYKNPIGAVKFGEKITFRVKGNFNSVVFVCRKDEDNSDFTFNAVKKDDYFEVKVSLDVGLYWYKFILGDGRYIGCDENNKGIITDTPNCFQLSIYSDTYTTPDWLKGGIIYQIFPDRFNISNENVVCKNIDRIIHLDKKENPIFMPNDNGKVLNNDFFGGDINGIIQKLPYLKSLGVSAIYLNPIFKAYSNHRYDTGDYMVIDEMLGTEFDFDNLIKKANEFKIKIILDGVLNHTGDDSLYFNKYGKYNEVGAYNSPDSQYSDWFCFTKYPSEYNSWWGITTLPTTNKNSNSFLSYITGKNGVIEKWTKKGIGGWRLDVVDELPSHFVEKIRESVKKVNNDAVIIGEVWEDASNKIAYGVRRKYFLGNELDSVMNYPLKNAILNYVNGGDCALLSKTVGEQLDRYPSEVRNLLMNILSTHDTVRVICALSNVDYYGKSKEQLSKLFLDEENLLIAIERLKIATILQYTLFGVPSIYYGDEVGMQGFFDPYNRKFFPWGEENVEIQNWYKLIGNIRNSYSAFTDGEFKEVYANGGLYAFIRSDENSQILIVTNVGNNNTIFEFDGTLVNLIDKKEYVGKLDITNNFAGIFVVK